MDGMQSDHFTEPTNSYWQSLLPAESNSEPPFRHGYPARLPDGQILMLPIRQRLDNPKTAVGSFIPNHAAFSVIEVLSTILADRVAEFEPEIVVGMPTLGLALAPLVAQRLGHSNYVPLGYSRKFWYDEALSVPVRSITTPDMAKRVYLDPNLIDRVAGRRLLLVDDTISSGTTALAVHNLLQQVEASPVCMAFAMDQGRQWRECLPSELQRKVRSVFHAPWLQAVEDGWEIDHSR